jgi:flagellar hook-associated protein 3 FlgL
MRVASNVYQMQWLASIQRKQAELAAIQQQTSTGKRVSTAADDPAGAAQALLLQQGLDRLTNFKSNADTASRRLSLEEVALSQGSDAMNRVRELAIQAANATQTRDSRSAMVAEVRELLASLFDTANAQDGQGNYLFAGNQVQSRPFVPVRSCNTTATAAPAHSESAIPAPSRRAIPALRCSCRFQPATAPIR